MPEKHYGSPNPQGERMTSKGEGSFPPRDRNRNCRRCGGWGWQNYDHDELALIDTIEELSQLVFGREFFLIGLGSDKPSMRFCPGCCGRERKVRDEVFLADCHEVVDILREISELQQDDRDLALKNSQGICGYDVLNELTGPGIAQSYGSGIDRKIKRARPWRKSEKTSKASKPKRSRKSGAESSAKQSSIADDLTKLAALFEKGALTKKEFQQAKEKLLGD